jgi:hypothetical protein
VLSLPKSTRVRVKVCFLLLLERVIQIFSNSGLLFCAVLSKTLFARLFAGAAAEDVCKVGVVCHANTLVEVIILLGRWYVPEGLQ